MIRLDTKFCNNHRNKKMFVEIEMITHERKIHNQTIKTCLKCEFFLA